MTEDNKALALEICKSNLGLSSTIRDKYLEQLIDGAAAEITRKGVTLTDKDSDYTTEYIVFVADFAAWRYRSRGSSDVIPRDLRYRLNCLIIGD